MTYFGFLLRFVLLPILLLAFLAWRDARAGRALRGFEGSPVWRGILVHVLLALVYTTPWDNYLVASGVWSYNPQLVTGIVFGWVPLEEYTFFVAQTILCGLWWLYLARRLPAAEPFQPSSRVRWGTFGVLFAAWLVFTALFFGGPRPATYLSITLFWALPAIFPQALVGADILWHHRKLVFWTIFPTGLYLSQMDIVALRATTWSISPAQTTGVLFFGILPLEEVVFFFITNVLVAFGLTLLLSHLSLARLKAWWLGGFKNLA